MQGDDNTKSQVGGSAHNATLQQTSDQGRKNKSWQKPASQGFSKRATPPETSRHCTGFKALMNFSAEFVALMATYLGCYRSNRDKACQHSFAQYQKNTGESCFSFGPASQCDNVGRSPAKAK